MDATGASGAEAVGAARPGRRWPKAQTWWATGFVVVTVVALVALDWALLMVHALGYGFSQVLGPDGVASPDTDRYIRALVVGGLVDVAGTTAMLWLLLRTTAGQWPAWTTALLAAAVGGVVGASALVLVLGISPIDLLLS